MMNVGIGENMPGFFGGIGCNLEIYDSLKVIFESIWGRCKVFTSRNSYIGAHAFFGSSALYETKERLCFAVDGEDAIYRNAFLFSKNGKPKLFTLIDDKVELSEYCKGNVAIIDLNTNILYLAVDWTGSFPLYYAKIYNGIVFSSHQKPLAKIIKAIQDPVGIIEFLKYSYTFSGRTHFKEIQRILPGQVIAYESITNRLKVYETSKVWTKQLNKNEAKISEITNNSWITIGNAVKRCLESNQNHAIMASAGWDSRLLFAGIRQHIDKSNLIAYSHGDLESRELYITSKIYKNSELRHLLIPLDNSLYDLQTLQRGFDRVENVIFPHWLRAGVKLEEIGVKCVSAGIFGEVIGGHYNKSRSLSDLGKALFVASKLLNLDRILTNRKNNKELNNIYNFFSLKSLDRPWYIKADFWESIQSVKDDINADIKKFIRRIESRGVKNTEQLVEAYITESRGSHCIAPQLLTCRSNLNISYVFGDKELLDLASQIPLSLKINNSLSQAILYRYANDLLNYPMGAILVSARKPIIVQEATRILRKSLGQVSQQRFFFLHNYFKPKIFGWDNFDFLRDGKVVQELLNDIRNDIFDKNSINNFIQKRVKFEQKAHMFNISNQLMAIYTTDLMLR